MIKKTDFLAFVFASILSFLASTSATAAAVNNSYGPAQIGSITTTSFVQGVRNSVTKNVTKKTVTLRKGRAGVRALKKLIGSAYKGDGRYLIKIVTKKNGKESIKTIKVVVKNGKVTKINGKKKSLRVKIF